MDSDSLNTVRRALQQRLESLQRAGVAQLARPQAVEPLSLPATGESEVVTPVAIASASSIRPIAPAVDSRLAADSAHTAAPVQPMAAELEDSLMVRGKKPTPAVTELPTVSIVGQPYPTDGPRTIGDKQHDFSLISDIVAHCTLCKELAATRTQTVFGVGNLNARVAFFGEAPGADEDRQGEPFVGRAGQLLTKIIEACGWQREDVYILNVLKCRPPDNRTPLPPEIDNCRQYFQRQFEVIQPEFIVCAGAVPAQALLETTEAVGKLRGRFHQYRGSKVLVTYHPAYLLRNPAAKKFVWDDMQILLKEMGLPIPGKKTQ